MKKLYLVFFTILFAAAVFAQDKKVMVVSLNLPAADSVVMFIMNKIDSMDGIAATHVPMADMKAGSVNYADYDAAILTENGGSADMATYHATGWPLPTVCLKAYILYKTGTPLFTQVNDVTWKASDKNADWIDGLGDMIVKDNSDILKCWAVNEQVAYTTGYNPIGSASGKGSGEAHIQTFDLTEAVNVLPSIVSSSTPIANSKLAVDLSTFPATLKSFMWKVEENVTTKRCVFWGIHHTMLLSATDAFYTALKNSLRWVLKQDCECPGTNAMNVVEARPYQMYPNPVVDQLNFSNAGSIACVDVIDITGKVLMTTQNDNNQLLLINTSNLAKGMYFVRVNTTDGVTYSDKLVK